MSGHDHSTHDHQPEGRTELDHSSPRVALWIFLAFAAVAALVLIAEHRLHVLGALPYLLLLACPLMHLFMHRSHGGHRRGGKHE